MVRSFVPLLFTLTTLGVFFTGQALSHITSHRSTLPPIWPENPVLQPRPRSSPQAAQRFVHPSVSAGATSKQPTLRRCPDPPFQQWALDIPQGGAIIANGTNEKLDEDFGCLAPRQSISLKWEIKDAATDGHNRTENRPLKVSIGEYTMKNASVQPGQFCPTDLRATFSFNSTDIKMGSRVAIALRSEDGKTLAYAKEMFVVQKECKSRPGK